jgi:hypothetical protein
MNLVENRRRFRAGLRREWRPAAQIEEPLPDEFRRGQVVRCSGLAAI